MQKNTGSVCLYFYCKVSLHIFYFFSNYCESNIGKKGGKQTLYLGTGCRTRGHVTHELMHALGFFHEHTRPDRNKFVKILWDNIKKGIMHTFYFPSPPSPSYSPLPASCKVI